MRQIQVIITEGYYSSHVVLGLLVMPKRHYGRLKKEIAVIKDEMGKWTAYTTTMDEYFDAKDENERKVLERWGFGGGDPRPTKLEVMKRILERQGIPYQYIECDELNLGDYWGEL